VLLDVPRAWVERERDGVGEGEGSEEAKEN